ncbi:radical SAM protein [Marinifilum sp. D714]|uniref:SPL family radical SAM protein n=1 Tax=Marinifilum sp. D714 TaxID=2937523 RepID=UPI0027CBB55E|nr:radical SAM protein [Marinifilum sp. D714]MDQ2179568.1 radical SAM protein [Marinifilum sp. D714]
MPESNITVQEKIARSILSTSKVHTYTLNAYTGCEHACSYCYARFMKKYTKHDEAWGKFVDVKTNAAELLKKEVLKKQKGKVWMSGTCDPYQPLEKEYEITRSCLEVLAAEDWPVIIQTRSPLVLRDLDLFQQFTDIEIGLSIPTGHDRVREIFEPSAPAIIDRINVLKELKVAGLRTYAMIAPLLPRTENLVTSLAGVVDYIIVDKLNYHYADHIFKKLNREQYLKNEYSRTAANQMKKECDRLNIKCQVVF